MSRTTFLMRHAKSGARTRKSAVPEEPGPFESIDDLRRRTLLVDPVLLDDILYAGKKGPGIEARSERELYTRLSAYTATLCKKADAVGRTMRGMNTDAAVYRYARKARSMRTSFSVGGPSRLVDSGPFLSSEM